MTYKMRPRNSFCELTSCFSFHASFVNALSVLRVLLGILDAGLVAEMVPEVSTLQLVAIEVLHMKPDIDPFFITLQYYPSIRISELSLQGL